MSRSSFFPFRRSTTNVNVAVVVVLLVVLMLLYRSPLQPEESQQRKLSAFSLGPKDPKSIQQKLEKQKEDIESEALWYKTNNDPEPIAIKRLWDICPENNPSLHGILHERRSDLREHYESNLGDQMYRFNGYKWGISSDRLITKTIRNGKFAIYSEQEQEYYYFGQGSAWNSDEVIDTTVANEAWTGKPLGSFIPPLLEKWESDRKVIQLPAGNYVAYTGWMYGNLGHFIHDNLPNIAYLKYLVPSTTKFLLGYDELHARILKFIDPVFYERIHWMNRDEHIVEVTNGTLTVTTAPSPSYLGCCEQLVPLRQWVAQSHPEVPDKKVVVFYTRGDKETGMRNEDNKHGRVLDLSLEKVLLEHIRLKLLQYNRTEEVVIFDGKDNGETMSIENQFKLFRSASTIIGPHGTGLGGNYIWTNPFATSCDDRVQVLEFLPGKESAHVQALHASYFMQYRKWPFEYHHILYNNASTPMVTQIDIGHFDTALDAMWGGPETRIKTTDYHSSAWEPEENTMSNYLEQVQTAKAINNDHRLSFA